MGKNDKITDVGERDLTLQDLEKKMQEKLDELNQLNSHLKTILGNMRQGLIFIQANGMVTTYNPAAEILIGLEEKKVLWHSIFKNFPDEFFGFSLKEVLKNEYSPPPKIISFRSFLGIDRVMEVESTFVSQNPHNSGLLLLIRDISEFHRLQIETARQDRFKTLGEVSAHIVHAIRNPLSGIRGFASLLRENPDDKQIEKYIGFMIEGIDALNDILNGILDFSRPYSAKKRLIDVVKLLKDFEEECVNDKDIEVKFLSSHLECPLEVDPNLLKRALWNIIRNSFDAMPNGGTLTLSLSKKEEMVTIGIADTGSGISPDDLKSLFQPFFSTKPRGNGFGLMEVQKIMASHKGTVEITSSEDKGTYVSLNFYP